MATDPQDLRQSVFGRGTSFDVALLLVVTLLIALFTLRFNHREVDLTPHLTGYAFTDAEVSGESVSEAIKTDSSWRFKYQLRFGFAYPFAGIALVLDSTAPKTLRNFENFDQLHVRILHHRVDSSLFRVWISSNRSTQSRKLVAPGEIQYKPQAGWSDLSIDWKMLRLTSWWIAQNKTPISEQAVRLDDVVSINVVTPDVNFGSDTGTIEVGKVWLEGPIIKPAILLWGVQVIWILWGLTFLFQGWFAWRRRAKQAESVVPRVKTEFLATMSHEIRTPLNGMIVPAQLLLDSNLGPEDRIHVQTILESGDHLAAILQDALDYFKIEGDKLELENAPFSVRSTVEAVARAFESKATEKGIAIKVKQDPNVPKAIDGDAPRLRQILVNLLSNAVKFTEKGEIWLEVTCIPDPSRLPGQDRILFSIKDTGIGMDPTESKRLFEKFTQLDSSLGRRYGGTGLGLAIAQGLANKMGGTISVTSAAGVGSTFSFSIPFQPATLDADPATDSINTFQTESVRVLVVDDNRVNLRVAKASLVKMGCQVQEASGGLEALSILESQAFHLILMDCHMPEMDGFEASLAIRSWRDDTSASRRRAASTPIVALTADVLPDIRMRCLAAKMDGVIPKPFRQEQLARDVARWAGALHEEESSPPMVTA
ncbi:MAG: response regulator [Fibrobacterota bacterium]|nr:MAG: response regulator [Fibrobacterota bacterium]